MRGGIYFGIFFVMFIGEPLWLDAVLAIAGLLSVLLMGDGPDGRDKL